MEAFFARGRLGIGVTCVAGITVLLADDGVDVTTAGAGFVVAGIFATAGVLDLAPAALDLAAAGVSRVATAAGGVSRVATAAGDGVGTGACTEAGVDVATAGVVTLTLGGSVGFTTPGAATSRSGAGRAAVTVSADFVGE